MGLLAGQVKEGVADELRGGGGESASAVWSTTMGTTNARAQINRNKG